MAKKTKPDDTEAKPVADAAEAAPKANANDYILKLMLARRKAEKSK